MHLPFHKRQGTTNGCRAALHVVGKLDVTQLRMLQMVGIDVHPLGVLERELEIVEENAQFSLLFFLSKN